MQENHRVGSRFFFFYKRLSPWKFASTVRVSHRLTPPTRNFNAFICARTYWISYIQNYFLCFRISRFIIQPTITTFIVLLYPVILFQVLFWARKENIPTVKNRVTNFTLFLDYENFRTEYLFKRLRESPRQAKRLFRGRRACVLKCCYSFLYAHGIFLHIMTSRGVVRARRVIILGT